jgi:hypothetical protein
MRRSVLIAALRDPEMWPEDFYWNFQVCTTCGAGLAKRLGLAQQEGMSEGWLPPVRDALGLTQEQALEVFVRDAFKVGSHITPNIVADRLEKIHRVLGV